MASAVDKQPAAARLAAVAAAGYLPTANNRSQSSYTTPGDTTGGLAAHLETQSFHAAEQLPLAWRVSARS